MRAAIAIGALLSIAPVGLAESIAGMWSATLTVNNNLEVPF